MVAFEDPGEGPARRARRAVCGNGGAGARARPAGRRAGVRTGCWGAAAQASRVRVAGVNRARPCCFGLARHLRFKTASRRGAHRHRRRRTGMVKRGCVGIRSRGSTARTPRSRGRVFPDRCCRESGRPGGWHRSALVARADFPRRLRWPGGDASHRAIGRVEPGQQRRSCACELDRESSTFWSARSPRRRRTSRAIDRPCPREELPAGMEKSKVWSSQKRGSMYIRATS